MANSSGSFISTGGGSVTPSILIPQADGVGNTIAGSAGATGQVSDAGHIHPIAFGSVPALPAFVAGGGQTITNTLIWLQNATEQTLHYTAQLTVTKPTAGQWGTLSPPVITGYTLLSATFGNCFVTTGNTPAPTAASLNVHSSFPYQVTHYINYRDGGITLQLDCNLIYRLT